MWVSVNVWVFDFVCVYVCGCDNEYVCMSKFVLFVCVYLCGWVLMYVGVEWICGHFISAIELIKKTF